MIYLAVFVLLAAIVIKWFAFNARKDLRFQGGLRGIGASSTALFGLAALLFIGSSFTIIPAGHIGVQVLFGRVQPNALTEGMRLINPLVDIEEMSVRTETYTMSATSSEGQMKGDDSIQALSSDGLLMPLDITIAFRLDPGIARRSLLIGAGIAITVLVGLTRVYLRAHWLSDVTAGWALGFSAFAAAAAVALLISHFRDNPRPDDRSAERRSGAPAGARH